MGKLRGRLAQQKLNKPYSLKKGMVQEQFYILNSIWEKLGSPSLNSFSDRLILQKKVFLLQEMGLNTNYTFRKYLYGPYSSTLTKDSFKVDIKKEMPSDNEDQEEIFEKLKKLEEGHENDSSWFELLGTIVYLKNKEGKSKEEIRQEISVEKPYLYEKNSFENAYLLLENFKIIS